MRSSFAESLRAIPAPGARRDGRPMIDGERWDRLLAAEAEMVVNLEIMGYSGLAQRIDRKFSRFCQAVTQNSGGESSGAAAAFEQDDSLTELKHLVEATGRRLGADPEPKEASQREVEDEDELPPALTANQIIVMRTMARFDPSQLLSAARIEEAIDPSRRISVRTIGDVVRRLHELGYAERPEGDRRGARLTTRGRRILRKIAD